MEMTKIIAAAGDTARKISIYFTHIHTFTHTYFCSPLGLYNSVFCDVYFTIQKQVIHVHFARLKRCK